MLVNKLCDIVDLVVNHHEEVLLSVVLRNILICVLLRHLDCLGGNFAGSEGMSSCLLEAKT